MEFFEWLFVPQLIFTMIRFYGGASMSDAVYFSIVFGIPAALYLVCLIIGGLGLSRMAKFAGIGNRWMAFVPFLNTYYAQKLGGEASVFGAKMKRAGLYAMLVEIFYVLLNVFTIVLSIYLSQSAFYDEVTDVETGLTSLVFNLNLVPENMRWAYFLTNETGLGALDIVTSLLGLALVFFFCVLYNSVYRKYYIRSPFLLTFLSAVLPGRAFCLYAVRNNAPVDYDAYVRRMREEAARRAQQNGQPPYGGAPMGGSGPQEPFSDFGGGHDPSGGGHDPSGGGQAGDPSGGSGGDDSPFSDF